ncbi:MAG: PAS domain S-box protein, partial [Chitinophagaceae bacterium]
MFSNCQLLLHSIPHAILMTDKDGFIQYANPAAGAITGYHPDELFNRPLYILYNHSDEDSVKSKYEQDQALRQGRFAAEGWKLRKDGTSFWAETVLAPVYDKDGGLEGFSCTLTDTTHKKQEELELRQSEERFRLMVEGVQDYSIFMLDPQGYIMTWNDGAKNIKGYNAHEIIGKHFSIFYTAEDLKAQKLENEMATAIATGRYEEEGWRVKKNGSVFWASVVFTALYNEQNKLIGFSKVTRDLTERKHAEEALRQSEERYRMLVEQVTDYGIFMLDEKGRIISWNEGAKNIKGYTEAEILGKYFTIFYPEEDIISGKPAMELKHARAHGKYEEEGWRLRKDGTRFWANVVITAVYNPEGTLMGFSKVTRDLTERKKSEKALADSYEVYRRLTEELKVTNAELSYANEELEQFTSIVSHDLQEPVRTTKSFLQLIELKLPESTAPEVRTYVSKSIAAVNRMRQLIQNLLQYSQLARTEISFDEVSVDDLLTETLQNLKTSVDLSRADIVIENSVDTVQGDRVQLGQLLQNLVSNALKFTDADCPRVIISSSRGDGYTQFSVADNGIGIHPSDIGKVFEIF